MNQLKIINFKTKDKEITYFIITFLLILLFLYSLAFYLMYRYSQKIWFIEFLQSCGLISLVSIIICIIPSLFNFYIFLLLNLIIIIKEISYLLIN